MKPPSQPKKEQNGPREKRTLLSRLNRQRPATERRRAEENDEIDERELDKISGGRIHRIDI